MALFGSYAQPGVYTQVTIDGGALPLFGSARIPVIIGEGQEFFTPSNVEIHRGSSSAVDDQVVNENLSNQVTGTSRDFHTTYFPVVKGDGKGTTTSDVSKIQVTADGVPVTVVSLDGTTGDFTTQDLIPQSANLEITYFFKRTDTLIANEDLSAQIPAYASLTVPGAAGSSLVLTTTLPGAVGNLVTLTLTDAGVTGGVPTSLAVNGRGTDAISIEIRKSDHSQRTVADLKTLIDDIATLSAGYLVSGALVGAGVLTAGEASFAGGAGQSSNTVFKTEMTPIVDGSNGGVVTTETSAVTVLYDGVAASVSAVDGANGLVTLKNPALVGHTLTITYYTNTYQNTSDLLPAANVTSITAVGLGPDSPLYFEGDDFVLGVDGNGNSTINWGASALTTAGVHNGTVVFDASTITTALVDEKVYLRPVAGSSNGKNATFTLEDYPTDGSGLSRVTDDVTKVAVYVGLDPVSAFLSGTVKIAQLAGNSKTIVLYNPPQAGQNVYATYYRNTLNDHTYTVKVANPGTANVGTYTITDEINRTLPVAAFSAGTSTVVAGAFATAGLVWPNSKSDLTSVAGAVDETVTATFVDTGLKTGGVLGAQATTTIQGITFRATTVGTSGNSVTIAFTTVGSADAAAISGANTNALTVDILKADATTARTITEIVALFGAYPAAATTTGGGVILASGSGFVQAATASATSLTGGVNLVSGTAYAMKFNVTSTVAGGSTGSGWVGQTYLDAVSGLKFTVGDPQTASPAYRFAPGDTLRFTVSKSGTFFAGPTNIIIPGLNTTVVTTANMSTNDTALIQTFNKAGTEPNVGDFYYVSFTVAKTAQDMGLKLYTDVNAAYQAYGQPSVSNRLSLGIQKMVQNGAQMFGAIQVPKQDGLPLASDASFISAIQMLKMPVSGNTKAAVIVPLSTSTTVHQFLKRQLTLQADVREMGEAIGFVGYSQYTDANTMRANARGLSSERVIAIGSPLAVVSIPDSVTGVAAEFAVSGEFMAAAMAGMSANPANDVATTLTGQDMVGFSRNIIRFDTTTMNMMAADGLTMLTDNSGALNVRHYRTTRVDNVLYSEPTCTTVGDYLRQSFRTDLKQFIGRKLVDSLVTAITTVCNARLRNSVTNEIITSYQNLTVTPDPTDPTTVNISVQAKPMFSLLYIGVNFKFSLNA